MSHTDPSAKPGADDPMAFMKNIWGAVPGLAAFSFDVKDIEKRIQDLKTVEGWLRMNLSMLQATIQGLELQHNALAAMQNMHQATTQTRPPDAPAAPVTPAAPAAPANETRPWPWNMMSAPLQASLQAFATAPPAASGSSADSTAFTTGAGKAVSASGASNAPKKRKKTTADGSAGSAK